MRPETLLSVYWFLQNIISRQFQQFIKCWLGGEAERARDVEERVAGPALRDGEVGGGPAGLLVCPLEDPGGPTALTTKRQGEEW